METAAVSRKVNPRWIFAACFLLAALVFGLRIPDRIFEPQFRDEDAFVFFRYDGFFGLKAFAIEYGGFLYTLQRGVAWLAGFTHPRWAPLVYNWSSLLITATVCGRIAIAGLPAAWRAGFIALFLLHPFCLWNAIQLTNVLWFTAALFPVFAIERAPPARAGKLITIAVLVILGLSGPFGLIFTPLFVLRCLFLERSRYAISLAASVALTSFVQGFYLFSSVRTHEIMATESPSLSKFWTAANRFVVHTLFGGFADETSTLQSLLGFAIIALFAAGSAIALRRTMSRKDGIRAGMLLAGAALIYAGGVLGNYGPWLDVIPGGYNTRYYILPYLLFGWAVIALACAPGLRWMRLPAAALILVTALSEFRSPALPHSTWAEDLRRVQDDGFGFVRLNPDHGHCQLFMAKGDGRYGFARGEDLMAYHSEELILREIFGLQHAKSVSEDAPIFLFPQKLGGMKCVTAFCRTHIGIVIPKDAAFFSGVYGHAPLALPIGSADGIAGGDGFLFEVSVSDGRGASRTIYRDFVAPARVGDPASLRNFKVAIPPGEWRSVVLHNLTGPTPDHDRRYDFALLANLGFTFADSSPEPEPPSPAGRQ